MRRFLYLLFCGFITTLAPLFAQQSRATLVQNPNSDSIPVVDISSEYEPTTLLSTKEMLQPRLLQTKTQDTIHLHYRLRPASLLIPYQPVEINPLVYEMVEQRQKYNNYFSVFSGNTYLNVPKMRLAFGFGNGRNLHFMVYGSHTEERGRELFQQYRKVYAKFLGRADLKKVNLRFGYQMQDLVHFKYGTSVLNDSIKNGRANLRNYLQDHSVFFKLDTRNTSKVLVQLNSNVHYAILNALTQEVTNTHTLQINNRANEKTLWFWDASINYVGNFLFRSPQITRQTPVVRDTFENALSAQGSVRYQKGNIGFSALFNTSYLFSARRFYFLPNLHFYYKINQDIMRLHAGWAEHIDLNTMRSLYLQNPWINSAFTYSTTRWRKWFLGVNGAWKNTWAYSLRVAFEMANAMPIFINALNSPHDFQLMSPTRIRSLATYLGVSYTLRDQFRLAIDLHNHNYLWRQDTIFGLSPLAFTGSAQLLRLFKIVQLKASFTWRLGTLYQVHVTDPNLTLAKNTINEVGPQFRTKNTFDLSLSLHVKATRFLDIYAQATNILNRANPLWFYYNAMPFSIGGGLILYFNTLPFNVKKNVSQGGGAHKSKSKTKSKSKK